MKSLQRVGTVFLSSMLGYLVQAPPAFPQTSQVASETGPQNRGTARDGQHDFDFNIGTWKTHISRLQNPLTGSTTWVEYDGISVVREILNGRASLNWTSGKSGVLGVPTIQEFKNGRGVFVDQESLNDRVILVRNSFMDITPDSARFERTFSDDGGGTWETNWVMTFKRLKAAAKPR